MEDGIDDLIWPAAVIFVVGMAVGSLVTMFFG